MLKPRSAKLIVLDILEDIGAAEGFNAGFFGDGLLSEERGLLGLTIAEVSMRRGPARIAGFESRILLSFSLKRVIDRADIRSCAPLLWTSGSLSRLFLGRWFGRRFGVA